MITLDNRQFERYIPNAQIEASIDTIAEAIHRDYAHINEPIVLLTVLNGGAMFGMALCRRLSLPMYVDFMRVSSYTSTTSSGKPEIEMGFKTNINEKHVILLEDIVDTGITLNVLLPFLANNYQLKSLKLASLFCKPDAIQIPVEIDYLGMNVHNKYLVGYGLDINGLGRNLLDLYSIVA